MFGLFRSPPFHDAELGEFVRSRGYWRGTVSLASQSVPIALAGSRGNPDSGALALGRQAQTLYASMRPLIEAALFEHYEPYAEALEAGELPATSESFQKITEPSQVWPNVSLVFVSISPIDGVLTTEFGFTTAWDEEHTLGARFQNGALLELCGSVLPP